MAEAEVKDAPNPGSAEAVMAGCTCPVLDNNGGWGWTHNGGEFVIDPACPLHAPKGEGAVMAARPDHRGLTDGEEAWAWDGSLWRWRFTAEPRYEVHTKFGAAPGSLPRKDAVEVAGLLIRVPGNDEARLVMLPTPGEWVLVREPPKQAGGGAVSQ